MYTCAWLAEHDPGCTLNACGSVDDYGQCSACPVTCDACSGQRATSSLIPAQTHVLSVSTRSDGAQRLTIDGLDDLEADAADARNAAYVDDTPVVLVVTPLLLLAGILGAAGAFLDLRGEAEQQALVSELAAGAAMTYIVLLLGGIAAYVPLHPDMCTHSQTDPKQRVD